MDCLYLLFLLLIENGLQLESHLLSELALIWEIYLNSFVFRDAILLKFYLNFVMNRDWTSKGNIISLF